MQDKSDLYYECHVSLVPVREEQIASLQCLSEKYDFRTARFVMDKDGLIPDAFTSGRDISYASMAVRMVSLVKDLQDAGFTIKRYKIENTLLDSKNGHDPFGLIAA